MKTKEVTRRTYLSLVVSYKYDMNLFLHRNHQLSNPSDGRGHISGILRTLYGKIRQHLLTLRYELEEITRPEVLSYFTKHS